MSKDQDQPIERKYNARSIDKRYYSYFDICKLMGIPSVRAKNAVNRLKVEGIKNIEELAPIEHLFEVFENPRAGEMRYSYGILRRYFDEWQHTGEVPIKRESRVKQTNLSIIKARIPTTLKDELTKAMEDANAISVRQVTYGDVLTVAIREYLDRRFTSKEI